MLDKIPDLPPAVVGFEVSGKLEAEDHRSAGAGAGLSRPPPRRDNRGVEHQPMAGSAQFEILSEEECRSLLEAHDVGRVGFVIDDFPVVLPVNYAVVGDTIVVRTAPGVVTAGVANQPVAFEVDRFERWNRSGWSVLAQGHGRDITEASDDRSQALRHSYIDAWAPGDRAVSLTIDITHLSGRRIRRTMGTSSSTYE